VAIAAATFEGSFPLSRSFNRFGSMERAPKVCLFVCISSSRDRLKFKLHFFEISKRKRRPHTPSALLWLDGEWRRAAVSAMFLVGVVPFQRGMRELAFSLYFHLKCSSFRARTRPNLHSTLQFSSLTPCDSSPLHDSRATSLTIRSSHLAF